MNKILKNAALASLSTSSYLSPEVTVAEISNEGVLCSSTPEATLQEWENGTINW